MNESAQVLRAAAALLRAKANELDGGVSAKFDPNDWKTWWPAMQEQFRNDSKPHEWRDWTSGMSPSSAGDNSDTPDSDAFMRAFQPMMTAAGQYPQQSDSTGAVFFAPNIRKRGGWPLLKKECLALVLSQWGQDWMAHPLNAPICPKPQAIALLMQQVNKG